MLDFAARGLAAQNRSNARRLATLDTLARGIAENTARGLPVVMGTPIAESRASSTTIASGTSYGFSSSTPGSDFRHRYGLYGGDWTYYSTTVLHPVTGHPGNGSNPNSGELLGPARVCFATFAEKFEIAAQNYLGFRVRINGKYAKAGMYGVQALNGDGIGQLRWWAFDCAGTEFAGEGLKLVEIEAHFDFRFAGVRVPIAHTVQPWPQALPVKAALHGDSIPSTVSDSGDYRTAQHGLMPQIVSRLTGISDLWANNLGGCGYIADVGGTRSDFVEQASVDFVGEKFDLVWGMGSRNDFGLPANQAAYQALIQSWVSIVLADNPDALIFLTGPIYQSSAAHASAAVQLQANATKAVAAASPRNCAYIETTGNAVVADPWVFGTGKQGATTGNGNADVVIGPDGTHPTIFGHQYLGGRLVSETARVLPWLASRIRDGVIPGANDFDLV